MGVLDDCFHWIPPEALDRSCLAAPAAEYAHIRISHNTYCASPIGFSRLNGGPVLRIAATLFELLSWSANCRSNRPLGFILTGGEASGYKAVPDLLAIPAGKPRSLLFSRLKQFRRIATRYDKGKVIRCIPRTGCRAGLLPSLTG
ncbi:hypothetical protein ACC721_29300 [Rhizobium ruizarguesonis]